MSLRQRRGRAHKDDEQLSQEVESDSPKNSSSESLEGLSAEMATERTKEKLRKVEVR